MSHEPKLDLRSLAEVDEPDVVKAALAAFRRRLWTRYVWIVVVAVLAAAAVVVATRPDSLRDRIDRTNAYLVRQTWDVGKVRVGLDEIAPLGEDLGLHLTVVGPPTSSRTVQPDTMRYAVRVQGATTSESWGMWDEYVEVPRTADGRIRVQLAAPDCGQRCGFVIDLRALGIPASDWKP